MTTYTVRVYTYNGTDWTQLGSDLDGELGDNQGTSVTLSSDGTTLAVGSRHHDNYRGRTRIYSYNGTDWTQLGSALDGDDEGDQTGVLLSLSSDGKAVAIGGREISGDSRIGHVMIYNYNGTSWSQVGSDIVGEATNVSNKPTAVSLSSDGTTLAVQYAVDYDDDKGMVGVYNLINDNQVSTDIFLSNTTIDENLTVGTQIGTLSSTDLDTSNVYSYFLVGGEGDSDNSSFSINGNSLLSAEIFDFDLKATYNIRIQSDDGKEGIFAKSFGISVNDANEKPIITSDTFTLAENSDNGTVLGTVEASDPDGDTLTYTIVSGNDAEGFSLNSNSGELTVKDSSALDYETITSFDLLVQVSDGLLADSALVLIKLMNSNELPMITSDTFTLAENSDNGTVLGTVEASDPDGDTLTYTIVSGNDAEGFSLNSSTGELTVKDSSALDYETITSFDLLVQVSDGLLADSALVLIKLMNSNELPMITSDTFTLAENSVNGTLLGNVEASDPDGDTLTYVIVSGNDGEGFSLDSESGELTVSTSSALDFETTPSYSLGIEVSDGVLSDVAIFTINLTDVEEEEETLSLADASEMIYPNPSDGIVNIKMAAFKEATIYNLSGKRIMRSTDNRIDVSELSEGVYIIKLENRSGDRFSTRLIKE